MVQLLIESAITFRGQLITLLSYDFNQTWDLMSMLTVTLLNHANKTKEQHPVCVETQTGIVISFPIVPFCGNQSYKAKLPSPLWKTNKLGWVQAFKFCYLIKTLFVKLPYHSCLTLFNPTTYSKIFEDENGAHSLAWLPCMTPWSKHIVIPYYFFCEYAQIGPFRYSKLLVILTRVTFLTRVTIATYFRPFDYSSWDGNSLFFLPKLDISPLFPHEGKSQSFSYEASWVISISSMITKNSLSTVHM